MGFFKIKKVLTRTPLSLFSVDHLRWACSLPLRGAHFPSDSLEKTKFSFARSYQLEISPELGLGAY